MPSTPKLGGHQAYLILLQHPCGGAQASDSASWAPGMRHVFLTPNNDFSVVFIQVNYL
jgi:hypothetical protein